VPRGIFLISADNQLTELVETPYESEDLLQRLLADHPGVLAGDAEDGADRRRWLLVTREAAIPDEEDGAGRWSVDHVFLDQDAVPTLVEVKRSTDTRIRREVVGQMLDYAANALAYWPAERLRMLHETRCSGQGIAPDDDLRAVLGQSIDPEEFWQRAKTNLTAGRLRLVFVSDAIPNELRRIVEFLNGQMDPVEVLAIEVRQYVSGELRTLVPVVLGQTAEAEQRKGKTRLPGTAWDEERFMNALTERAGQGPATTAAAILRWSEQNATRVTWGSGTQDGSFVPVLTHRGVHHAMFAAFTYGRIEIYFQYYREKRPFDDERKRRELLNRLNAIPGVQLPADAINRRPSIPLAGLADPTSLREFLEVFEWYRRQIFQSE
jgi:hypothetical protein